MALNLSKLFDRDVKPSFLKNISPIPTEEASLKEAKTAIMRHLKISIPKWIAERLGVEHSVEPHFRTQGSWAYKTCNEPCQYPPQEMDWDLGIYLPISLWDNNDIYPRAAAKTYYGMVRELMTPLAAAKNWTLSEKHTCVRVTLNNGVRAHVDLPLYVAPDKEFHLIKETAAKAFSADQATVAETITWDSLTRISLACQDGSWSSSDPGRVVIWFDKKLQRHGPQLRRISRYLKAWRDHNWTSGGPSSIVLMVCAAQSLDRAQANFSGRDDRAMAHVLQALPAQLSGSVKEPMIDPNEDLNRLTATERHEAANFATRFREAMNQALTANIAEHIQAIQSIQSHLGQRFPSDTDGVISDDGPPNIRTVPAEPKLRPTIVPTKAG